MKRLILIPCPACGMAAEVTARFSLACTGGSVPHLALRCLAGHVFRMPSDLLPAEAQEQLRVQDLQMAVRHAAG